MLQELIDGFLPRPRRGRAVAGDADLIRYRYSRRELSDQFLRVLAAAAPALEFAGALTGDVGLCLGTADDPTPLRAKKSGPDSPRDLTSADPKLQPRALRIGQIIFSAGLGFAGRRFDAFQGNLGFRQFPGHAFSLKISGHTRVTTGSITTQNAVSQQRVLKHANFGVYC